MNRLRWIGVVFAWLLVTGVHAQTQLETDEATLRAQNLPTDGKKLIEYFVKKSIQEGDAKKLEALVRKLDSDVYSIREPAKKELIDSGSKALPFLRGALRNTTLEAKRRAESCIEKIETGMQNDPIGAAARVLAASKEPKAAEILFNYLPSIGGDPFLEEEVLACVGRLTVTTDKVDPLVLNALKDPLPFRRTVAAYLIGRRGSAEHREQLRNMLNDGDARVPMRVAEGMFGKRPPQTLAEMLISDESLLRTQKIELTEPSLLDFLKKRTLSQDDQKRLRGLVKNLGSDIFTKRTQASEKLFNEGIPTLAFLKEAVLDADGERAGRAKELLEKIRSSNNTAVPVAVARLLAKPAQKKDASPAESIRALLAYIPFADDEMVEEEILTCLALLSLREPTVEPELVKALTDPAPIRRAAAAFVLGHVGTKEQVAKVQALLDDPHPVVRLRAAQGMLATRDKIALPVFVHLVKSAPAPYLPQIQDVLNRLAEEKGPAVSISVDTRDKAAKDWGKWLADNRDKIDLTDANDRESFLGLVTICEYTNQFGQINSVVSEGPRGNGAKRYTMTGVQGAMDAQTLPNGNILVAEYNGNKISERDTKGVIKWEVPAQGNPFHVQRLPNGNTFVAAHQAVMEFKPDKSLVYRVAPNINGQGFYIFGARKARNGNIVAISAQGTIVEFKVAPGAATPTIVHTLAGVQTGGNWCGVELLPNGNYLVASMNPGSVREIDRNGKEVWSKAVPQAFRATRMPNGNILAVSMNNPKQVVEIERSTGNIRWTATMTGQPWGVHYR